MNPKNPKIWEFALIPYQRIWENTSRYYKKNQIYILYTIQSMGKLSN